MKKIKLQPATHERACQVCGRTYTYPEKGSECTRHLCALCAGLPTHTIQVLKRMTQRVKLLERTVDKLVNSKPKPPRQEASP